MLPNIFAGITGPTSLVIISIIALIIFGPRNYPSSVKLLAVHYENLSQQPNT